MALPELKNSNKMADLIKLTNEISLIGFQDMTNFLEHKPTFFKISKMFFMISMNPI
jgi:ABC-type arginine transport system permease subunit